MRVLRESNLRFDEKVTIILSVIISDDDDDDFLLGSGRVDFIFDPRGLSCGGCVCSLSGAVRSIAHRVGILDVVVAWSSSFHRMRR